ncbi:LOW QUALITY PROTEIN: Retroelement [Phytophthora megakarya]|uniref:Retroelement n=1 Tax=Phytophthora megakarya TaxID=4795 RepID=A0A225WLT1_9STRA|nr:LOW QUALITY PROTEIN: Retroelement [Phytophthora megakarya]
MRRPRPAATPAEQVERVNAFDMYERGLIEHLQAPVAEPKLTGPKPLWLKVHPYEGKEGENLHFWVREIELAMDVVLISTERLRAAFALSNLGGRAKTWAYTREATSPGSGEQLRTAFLLANYEYRQRSRFLACKQGKRELHEYIQEMRVLAASLVGNPLPEHIKVTVFMDGLSLSPIRTQLFRVQASTMEEAIQVALQEEYSHIQARTPTSAWQVRQEEWHTGILVAEPVPGQYPCFLDWPSRAISAALGAVVSGTWNLLVLQEDKGSFLPDLMSKTPPSQLPPDRGIRHEIDLVPGTKYCVTKQWPLPREQCDVIDAFFAAKVKIGMVREPKYPHSTPTLCVRKPNGNATVPAQTPIPPKDVLLNNMPGCTLYSALDLVDGYYQILMRESDIPLTAVSTPSGMLWEWLVMPQGLSNAPATFNRLVTQSFRPLRAFTQTHFDDIFGLSRAEGGKTAIEVHVEHLRRVFEVIRASKLYANIDKCVLGCYVSSVGVRADPEKVNAIATWPTPRSQKDLRNNYLHKYSAGYAGLARPLSDLLKKERRHQNAFDIIKASLQRAPVLALPDESKPFTVVCDASDYAINCALLQEDTEGRDQVISFQSRQLKAAERNYPVHDKKLLAMKYALVKFRVHLLGTRPFVVFTDHASLRTAINTPHLSQRMTRWLSCFVEYNFRVEYKPGKLNVLADALSRMPDYELANISRATTDLYDRIRMEYRDDESLAPRVRVLTAGTNAMIEGSRAEPSDPPRVVVPNDEDLKYDILLKAHGVPSSGHLGREKTFYAVSGTFWWPHMYKWVARYVKIREICQRVNPAGHASAPLQSLLVPPDCWKSISLDFVFDFPADRHGNICILVFVCRLSKMVHLAPVRDTVTGEQTAALFLDGVFGYHGLPESVVSDRDPRFTAAFWQTLFQVLGTRWDMSTSDHPQTDGQTERVNRVLEATLRSVCAEAPRSWSDRLPMVEFALNNVVQTSTELPRST